MPESTHAQRAAQVAMWALCVAVVVNAALYSYAVSNPMVSADNWIFIDTFLRNALEGRLDLGDFLVKRAGVDHAQPLNKLLMLLNYRWFGLDFTIEGLVGVAFGAAGIMVLYAMSVSDAPAPTRPAVFYALLAAVAAVWLSLNSSMIFSFSLVTLGYAPFLLAFVCIWATWHALVSGRLWPLAVAMALYGVIGDNSAVIAGIALAMLSLAWGWREGNLRPAWRATLVIAVALAACRGFYIVFGEIRGETLPEFNVPLGQRVAGLAAQWRDAWKWIAIPVVSGLVYVAPLQRIAGEHWQAIQMMLAAVMVAAHGWFWWAAWRMRARAASFLAAALMLLFYGYLAALLLSRVFVRGAEYLDQPRYVSFYQLGLVALLLMLAARSLDNGSIRIRRWGWASALAVLLAQIPLSMSAMSETPYIQQYREREAALWSALALDPAHPPANCTPTLGICLMPYERRVSILRMMREHRINLYAPRFERAHPRLARAATPALAEAKRLRSAVP